MIDWYREAEMAETKWEERNNVYTIRTAEEDSKTLMYKYLYNMPLNATDTNEAMKCLDARGGLHGSVTGRWGSCKPSWQFPFEFHCSDEMYGKHLKDMDFSKLEKRVLAMMDDDSYEEVHDEITINHGPTKRMMPTDFSAGASYTPEIKEGTYIAGTSSEALHMDYAKPTEWLNPGTAIVHKDGDVKLVPYKDLAKEDFEVSTVVDMESYDENGMYSDAVTGRAPYDKPNPLSFPHYHYTVTSENPATMNIEVSNEELWPIPSTRRWIESEENMLTRQQWKDLYVAEWEPEETIDCSDVRPSGNSLGSWANRIKDSAYVIQSIKWNEPDYDDGNGTLMDFKTAPKSFNVTGSITSYFQDNTLFEEYCKGDVKLTEWIKDIVATNYPIEDWFEADCIESDCDGYYDVDMTSCTCNAGSGGPCPSCESGELACTSCGDEPPEDTEETTSDVDGMWDALQDICRG